MTEQFTQEFYAEIRRRNKEKFIAVVSAEIEKEQAKDSGVNIPAFLEAEVAYNEFVNAGCLDEYGRLKPIPRT